MEKIKELFEREQKVHKELEEINTQREKLTKKKEQLERKLKHGKEENLIERGRKYIEEMG
ncbi:MAG: hypothetical protein ACFFDF_12055 [Candidatus Odinarchaeota archaeon]